jgi:GTPase
MDTCGHPKYQKTTIGGLTGDSPDFACVILSAKYGGLPDVSKEHITLSKLLNVPLMICITKIDITSASELTKTLDALLSFLKSPGISKLPVVIQNEDDLGASIPLFAQGYFDLIDVDSFLAKLYRYF